MQNPGGKKAENEELGKLAEQVKRLVDAHESASNRFAALYETNSRRASELQEKAAQDAIQSSEKIARFQSKRMQHAVAGLVISIVVACAGFWVSDYIEKQAHERELNRAEIQRKLEKLESISAALTDLRTVKDEALIDCGTRFYDAREIEKKRLTARNLLVRAARNADFYFGKEIYSGLVGFVAWESSFKDYCAKDLPDDAEWRTRHKAIEDSIRKTFPELVFQNP